MPQTRNQTHRSFLFVPGNKPERFDKALASGAHAVIIDLEDAVAPDDKVEARHMIADYLSPGREVFLRVNARGTPWFEQDALLCKLPGVRGVVLPKAESASDVTDLVSLVKAKIPVYPLIESAHGMWDSLQIAKAPFVKQLMFGTLDFMVDMNMELENAELNSYRAQLSTVSRVAGIRAPIDGVTTDINDVEGLTRDTLNGKRWGFAGKLCIHPKQVGTVNSSYAPSESDINWAKRVLEAFRISAGGAVSVDGKMVDKPVVLRAQSLLELADAR
ncbi:MULTISPECIES: CoA ester lyase [unclassified Caballeronia]|uniref:HpcH/HpaI aldolase/citrate lyase family protein n=1 Tax=unclassified Caballeronia TaxID=2646786 RepID=UPI002028F528|nr:MULTISPECIES: CoA ester lyase [unclassified Caballeronia]MDR5765868.1 CoA ester lyase [Caballeronia sp. LZ028]